MWINNGYELLNTDKYRKIVVSDKCVFGMVDKNDWIVIQSYKTDEDAENAREDIFDHISAGATAMMCLS